MTNLELKPILPRDQAILDAVHAYGWLTTQLLKQRVFPGNSSLKSVQRRLHHLKTHGYLATLTSKEGSIHTLAPAGKALFGIDNLSMVKIPLSALGDAMFIATFRVTLDLALEHAPSVFLKRFLSRFDIKSQGFFKGQHRFKLYQPLPKMRPSSRQHLFPKAACLLSSRGSKKRLRLCFLERDSGQGAAYWHHLGSAYHHYAQEGSWRKFGKVSGFTVLVIARSEKKREQIRLHLRDHVAADLFLITPQSDVTPEALLHQPIWHRPSGLCKQLVRTEAQAGEPS